MFKQRLRLPSPAIVISMVTLVLVLGGTAVAATVGGHADAKADTKLIKALAPTLSVKNAQTVGGKQVKQFSATENPSTVSTTILSVHGVTLKAACAADADPSLTVENDSGKGAMLGGYSGAGGVGNLNVTTFTSTPVDLNSGSNGGGFFTVQRRNGVVVSVQWAATGTLGGAVTNCYFSGSVIAS